MLWVIISLLLLAPSLPAAAAERADPSKAKSKAQEESIEATTPSSKPGKDSRTHKKVIKDIPKPDLRVLSLSADKTRVHPGQSIEITGGVKNEGPGTASVTTCRIRLRPPKPIGAEDFVLDTFDVPMLSADRLHQFRRTVVVPLDVPRENLTLLVSVDPDGNIREGSEYNNQASLRITVPKLMRATPLDLPKPDLRVRNLNVTGTTFHSGESVPVVVEVENQGPGGSYETTCEIAFFSKIDSARYVSLERITVPPLGSGDDASYSRLVTLPNDITRSTPSLLIAKVDPDHRVTEVDDGNNDFNLHITVTAPPPSDPPEEDSGGREDDTEGTGETAGDPGEDGETDSCDEGSECTVTPWQCGARPGFEVTGRTRCSGGVEQCEVLMPGDYCSIAGGPCGRGEGHECDSDHLCAPGLLCVGVGGFGDAGRCYLGHCEIPANFCWTHDEVGDPSLVCAETR